jgi:hypothetical protein
MSVPPQPAAQPHVTNVVVHPQPSNNLGLAGFITSLLGILSCGVLAPIGLLLSLIGLTKQPRGFAIAGSIIGLIGSIFLALMGVGIVMGMLGLGAAAKVMKDYADAHQTARQVYLQLDQQRKQGGAAIDTTAANAVASKHTDPWGTPLRAEVTANGAITVITAGRDKKFDTADDFRFDEATLQATSPTTRPGGSGVKLDD